MTWKSIVLSQRELLDKIENGFIDEIGIKKSGDNLLVNFYFDDDLYAPIL
jgi:hypothetical protein